MPDYNLHGRIYPNKLLRITIRVDKKIRLEQLHKRVIAEIQDYAIILLDINGTILSWNKGA